MKILAMDTSSAVASVALLEEDNLISELTARLERHYSSSLVPMIDQILHLARWKISDIDGYAVGLGPGSFTGIRVGLTTVKGLALVTKKPVVGISSLAALAASVANHSYVAPLVDAKRNLVYFAWYRCSGNGRVTQLICPSLGTLKEALSPINRPTLFIGDAVPIYQKQIRRFKADKAHFADIFHCFPRASTVGKMALKRFHQGKFDDTNTLIPTYLYSRYCSIGGNR